MNMKIENATNKVETGFSRAHAINEHAVKIINAAIAANIVPWQGIPDMIRDVHKAFAESYDVLETAGRRIDGLMSSAAPPPVAGAEPETEIVEPAVESEDSEVDAAAYKAGVDAAALQTAVPVVEVSALFPNPWDAVTHDALYCLIDGVAKKEMKRYVRAKHGLTWDQYRARFGLPENYPTVCKAASDRWSASAKRQGLGSTVTKVPKALREEAANAVAAEQDSPTPKSTRIVRGRSRSRAGSQAGQIAA